MGDRAILTTGASDVADRPVEAGKSMAKTSQKTIVGALALG
jgi:hypothetical protein